MPVICQGSVHDGKRRIVIKDSHCLSGWLTQQLFVPISGPLLTKSATEKMQHKDVELPFGLEHIFSGQVDLKTIHTLTGVWEVIRAASDIKKRGGFFFFPGCYNLTRLTFSTYIIPQHFDSFFKVYNERTKPSFSHFSHGWPFCSKSPSRTSKYFSGTCRIQPRASFITFVSFPFPRNSLQVPE